jgi:hypothetical protein
MKWLRRYLDKSSCDIERCSKSRQEPREARDGMGVAQPQRAPSIWPILGQMTPLLFGERSSIGEQTFFRDEVPDSPPSKTVLGFQHHAGRSAAERERRAYAHPVQCVFLLERGLHDDAVNRQ